MNEKIKDVLLVVGFVLLFAYGFSELQKQMAAENQREWQNRQPFDMQSIETLSNTNGLRYNH